MPELDPGAKCPSCKSTDVNENPEGARTWLCVGCGKRFNQAWYP